MPDRIAASHSRNPDLAPFTPLTIYRGEPCYRADLRDLCKYRFAQENEGFGLRGMDELDARRF
jgi:hypothetical protein